MRPQIYSTDLCDPNTVYSNESGQLTHAQRSAIHSWLLRDSIGSYALIFLICAGFVFIAFNAGFVRALWGSKDPLSQTFHIGATSVTIPLLRTFLIVILLAWLLTLLGRILRLSRYRKELLHGRVTQAQGVVLWHGAEHLGMIAGTSRAPHSWRLPPADSIQPGAYEFLYLPFHAYSQGPITDNGVGWLLSLRRTAEPAAINESAASAGFSMPPGPEDAVSSYQQVLSGANGFMLDALPTNRAGRLTDAQARLFVRSTRHIFLGGLALALVFIVAGGIPLVTHGLRAASTWQIPAVAIGAFLLFRTLWPYRRSRAADISAGTVATIEGYVRRVSHTTSFENGESTTYYYDVNRMRFQIAGRAAYEALDETLRYRVYYLPHTKQMINIEPIAGGASSEDFLSEGSVVGLGPRNLSTLISPEEVAEVTGMTVSAPEPRGNGEMSTCVYPTAGGKLMLGFLLGDVGVKMFETRKKIAQRTGRLQPLSGIGDEAFFDGMMVAARAGNACVAVAFLDKSPFGDSARLVQEQRLAQLALSRL